MPNMGFDQLGLMIGRLDPTDDACNVRISELLRQMDMSCHQGDITLREWRSLLDRIVPIQQQLETDVQGSGDPPGAFGQLKNT